MSEANRVHDPINHFACNFAKCLRIFENSLPADSKTYM